MRKAAIFGWIYASDGIVHRAYPTVCLLSVVVAFTIQSNQYVCVSKPDTQCLKLVLEIQFLE